MYNCREPEILQKKDALTMVKYLRTVFFVMGLVTFVFQGMGGAAYYKWKDAEGSLHFTDDLTTVPPAFRDRARIQNLPDESINVTPAPAPAPASDTSTDTSSQPVDKYAECQKRVKKEKERWTRQLEENQDKLVELNRMIHRAVTSRKKNEFQRERIAVKERIAQAEKALRDTLPPMENECEAIRYWQGGE